MNDELRQRIMERLKRGEELPREWAQDIFPPEKMEYELVYHGKEREGDIIANTMAVPLQEVRTFGKNGNDDWHNMLILGDNLQVLKRLVEYKKEGRLLNADGTHGVRLIYIDPPFATKQEFSGKQNERAYQDKLIGAEFVEFLRKRLVLLGEILSDDGAIFVHLDQKKGHYIKVILDEIFGENNFRNEITVRRTQKNYVERGQISSLNLASDSVYVYAVTNKTRFSPVYKPVAISETWHALDAPNWSGTRPNLIYKLFGKLPPKGRCWAWSKERTKEAIKSGDLRPNPKTGKPEYRIPARDKTICTSLWDDITAYSFNSGYPTEKSEKLLERIIEMGSNPGDLVLDAFAGSGTTISMAEKLGRRWIGVDRGKLAIYTIQKRLLTLKKENGSKGKLLTPKPFTLYNAGLYDFATLQKMPREDWRFFALQLFECKDEKHKIGGLELDGKRRGNSVLVFNHHENPETKIDEEAIRSIHRRIGDKIGRSFYIIAPRHTFAFQQDYITFDDVKYYALRIPYSFINELHRREFSALQQPKDETAVNDLIDTEGFDFIQPPTVKYKTGVKKRSGQLIQEAFIKLNDFESKARVRGGLESRGMDAFSMLLLDLDYDGEVFQLHTHLYAKDMEAANWYAWFPTESIGKQIMAVFMDIYGNESSHVITRTELKLPKKKKG